MSGLAVFGLKFPSLLDYDKSRKDPAIESNLKDLYHVKNPPSDTYMRERLDELNPQYLRPAFKAVFAKMQRGKVLKQAVDKAAQLTHRSAVLLMETDAEVQSTIFGTNQSNLLSLSVV